MPQSNTTSVPPADRSSTQDVLPPYRTVDGPGVGMEPRVPQYRTCITPDAPDRRNCRGYGLRHYRDMSSGYCAAIGSLRRARTSRETSSTSTSSWSAAMASSVARADIARRELVARDSCGQVGVDEAAVDTDDVDGTRREFESEAAGKRPRCGFGRTVDGEHGLDRQEATDRMLTMVPPPLASMIGANTRVTPSTPKTLVLKM